MPFATSTYRGDADYSIDCTGDAVTGDEIRFERATFSGNYRRPRFAGFEQVTGRIVADNYGADKQQHTFTIALSGGGTTLIKGRNLYKEGCWRTPWPDETQRHAVAAEKHDRGDHARRARKIRIEERDHASC